MTITLTQRIKPASPRIGGRTPKILLLYPYSGNMNTSPPLGIAMIGAVLKKHGCEVAVADAAACYATDHEKIVDDALAGFKPDMIGLSMIVGNEAHAYITIKNKLAALGVPIIAGGPHATIVPEEMLARGLDIVVRGEGEETALDIVAWLRGEKDLEKIDGISYKNEENKIVHNPSRPPISDLDSLPFPAHELFNPADYFANESEYIRGGRLISSRGCPNKCSFCANPIFGRKFRYRSPDSIVAEMKYLSERYKADKFEFLDDAFTTNRKRIFELAEKLKKLPEVTFSCVTRLENLDEETIPALRSAGMYKAHIGVESTRPETLRRIHKNIDMDKLVPILKLLRKNGVESYLFFMHGFPWESAEDLREDLEGLKRLRPYVTYFSEGGVVTPYPGTEIYEEYREKIGFTDWWLRHWQAGSEPLHYLQPYYFFPYTDEQKAIICETLDFIFEHNRGGKSQNEYLRQADKKIKQLESQVADLDSQLHEIWNKSVEEKAKRVLNMIFGKKRS